MHTEDSGNLTFDQFIRNGGIRGEHTLFDELIRFPLNLSLYACDLFCRFIAENTDFAGFNCQVFFGFAAPPAHFPCDVDQLCKIAFYIRLPLFRGGFRVRHECLHLIEIHPVFDMDHGVEPFRFQYFTVGFPDRENDGVCIGITVCLEADLCCELFRQHRQEHARKVGGKTAFVSFFVEFRAGAYPCRNIGNMDSQLQFSFFLAFSDGNCIVEILCIMRVDRDTEQFRQVAAFDFQRLDLFCCFIVRFGIRGTELKLGGDGMQIAVDFPRLAVDLLHASAQGFGMLRTVVQQTHFDPVAAFRALQGAAELDIGNEMAVQRFEHPFGDNASRNESAFPFFYFHDTSDGTAFIPVFVDDFHLDFIPVQGSVHMLRRDENIFAGMVVRSYETESAGVGGKFTVYGSEMLCFLPCGLSLPGFL